ncbi:hypothetical protein [Leptolinea tardivitalis]|uniref:Uncharacterized protein n=1 Tax=Leptolinea tardivitalis TaxID=229920 RepID=A0A0P6WSK6_9CHLR|nr:hypothetical protein [Leptolinea tardivitalis]KPL73188.1 hypothetical protein ADM99_02810 [Leptolinea tardivitalis]GAP21290.1 hypothetical protein LTAR_01501 [Leptolinea tardivitalis]
MNTRSTVLVEPSVAKMLDPYSNPRTIPGGWDVSAIQRIHLPEAGRKVVAEPSVTKMLDPFSAPRTIPGGWDVSAFTPSEKNIVETYGDSSFQSGNTAGKNEPSKNTL